LEAKIAYSRNEKMTTAATLMLDTLSPAATPAAAIPGASGQSPFATVLAEGGVLQVSDLDQMVAANMPLTADGELGVAIPGAHGLDHAADPDQAIFALFDTTALASQSAPIAIPGLGKGAGVSPPATGAVAGTVAGTVDSALVAAQGVAAAPHGVPAVQGVVPATGEASPPAGGNQALAHAAVANPETFPAAPAADNPPALERARVANAGTGQPAHPVFDNAAAPGVGQPAAAGQTPPPATANPVALRAVASRGDNATPTPTPAVQAAPVAVVASAATAPDPQLVVQAATLMQQQARASIDKGAATTPALRQPVALAGDVAVAAMPNAAADAAKPPIPGKPQAATPNMPASSTSASSTSASSTSSSPPAAIAAKGGGFEQPINGASDTAPGKAGMAATLALADAAEPTVAPRVPAEARLDTANLAPQQAVRASVAASETAVLNDRPAAPPQPPAEQVALQLRNAIAKGMDQIRIQLRPATLGAVDITLDVSANARVAVQVVAERAETLELLRSDARGLERALQEAGLRADPGSLNFSLRGEGQQTADDEFSHARGDADASAADAEGADHDGPTPQQASNRALDINV
jgi:hypothetical protein